MKKNNKYILDFLDVGNSDLRVRQERVTTSDGATFEVATIEPNSITLNSITLNSKNSGKPPNDYHILVTMFSDLYLVRYGTKYIPAREDHNIFKGLIKAGASRDEIEKRLHVYFTSNLWFTKDTAVSIKAFRSRYNDIPLETKADKQQSEIDKFVKGE